MIFINLLKNIYWGPNLCQALCSTLVILRGSPMTLERNFKVTGAIKYARSILGSVRAWKWCHIEASSNVSQQGRWHTQRYKWQEFTWRTFYKGVGRVKTTNRNDEDPEDKREWEEVNTCRLEGMSRLLSNIKESCTWGARCCLEAQNAQTIVLWWGKHVEVKKKYTQASVSSCPLVFCWCLSLANLNCKLELRGEWWWRRLPTSDYGAQSWEGKGEEYT